MLSQKTYDFLFENRMRNSKAWFNEHKGDYQTYVLEPLVQLAAGLGPAVSSVDPQIVTEPRVDRTISRIYRDTRFSRDKMLYREEMWLSFKRDKHAFPCYPEFFFVIEPKGFLYGCGYYSPTAEAMDSLRELITAGDPAFKKALNWYKKQSNFVLDGDRYKRTRHPHQPEPLRDWLDRKSISLLRRSSDFNLLFSDRLADAIGADIRALAPVYNLFIEAERRKQ